MTPDEEGELASCVFSRLIGRREGVGRFARQLGKDNGVGHVHVKPALA